MKNEAMLMIIAGMLESNQLNAGYTGVLAKLVQMQVKDRTMMHDSLDVSLFGEVAETEKSCLHIPLSSALPQMVHLHHLKVLEVP
jgi:hypothetical protein